MICVYIYIFINIIIINNLILLTKIEFHMMEHPDAHDDTRSSPCSLQHSRGDFKFAI